MGAAGVNLISAGLFTQEVGGVGDGACGVNHIIHYNNIFTAHVADYAHNFRFVWLRPSFVNDGQGAVQAFGQIAGAGYAADVRRNDNHIFQLLFTVVVGQQRHGGHMIHRNIKKTLD